MIEFVNFFTEVMKKYVDLLFSLPLLDGVSAGSFILGCIIFSIVIGYLIGRFTLSGYSAESLGTKTREGRDEKRKESAIEWFKNYRG